MPSSATRAAIVRMSQGGSKPSEIKKALSHKELSYQSISYVLKVHGNKGSGATFQNQPKPKAPAVRTRQLKAKVEKKITRCEGTISISQLAKDAGTSRPTMSRLIHKDLGYKSFRRIKGQSLSDAQEAKRLARCRGLLQLCAGVGWENVLWTDEKLFTIQPVMNKQNNQILAKSRKTIQKKNLRIPKTQKPLSMMVWGGISGHGKTRLIVIPSGVKINSQEYIDRVLKQEMPHLTQRLFGGRQWLLQQDGAPAHTAKATTDWLSANNFQFIKPSEWPPNLPDLTPMDFSVWSILEQKACAKPHKDLDSLKRALKKAWDEIPAEQLVRIVQSVPTRLRKCIANKGGHIEE